MSTKKAKELKRELQIDGLRIPIQDLKIGLEKMKCMRITYASSRNGLILGCESIDHLEEIFEMSEIGDKYGIEVFEMPKKEFLELPDFDGFWGGVRC